MSLLEERKRGLTDPVMAAQILADDSRPATRYPAQDGLLRGAARQAAHRIRNPDRATRSRTPDWIAGGLDWGDWTQKFHGGRPSWGNETTELQDHGLVPSSRSRPAAGTRSMSRPRRRSGAYYDALPGRLLGRRPVAHDGPLLARQHSQHLISGAFGFSEYGLFNAHSSVIARLPVRHAAQHLRHRRASTRWTTRR